MDEFTLTVCEKSYTLENISDGKRGKLYFSVSGDSNFQVKAKLQDGTELSAGFGFVTGGSGAYHNRVIITVRSHLIEGSQR